MSVVPKDETAKQNDWRETFLGDFILINQKPVDEEAAGPPTDPELVPIQQALEGFDYLAVFFGADYCPYCKAFAPTVVAAATALEQKKCKVLFLSNDRTKEAFQNSLAKTTGIDVVPYDLEKTAALRDLLELKTIPALMILENKNFDGNFPTVVTNGRNTLVADPQAENFPWVSDKPMTFMDRFIIRGKYGNWWELGHHVNPDFPDQIYMDEHAVRARAGLLNIITWVAIINVWEWKDPDIVLILFPMVAYEFLTSLFVGLTPISPFGVLGTLMAIALHPEPLWKPARPKRFAWAIGLFLSTACFIFVSVRKELDQDTYYYLVRTTVMLCNIATWFESALGFCFGCFLYNTVIVPVYKLEECSECKL